MQHYFRPNFFVNTPTSSPSTCSRAGRRRFAARLVLAATLSPSYGIYSGFENFENVPVRPARRSTWTPRSTSCKQRALDGPLLGLVARLNRIRREHAALQRLDNITFLPVENDALIAYAKRGGTRR